MGAARISCQISYTRPAAAIRRNRAQRRSVYPVTLQNSPDSPQKVCRLGLPKGSLQEATLRMMRPRRLGGVGFEPLLLPRRQ